MSAPTTRSELCRRTADLCRGSNRDVVTTTHHGGGERGPGMTDPAKHPNVVLILADDLGFSDIGCYGGEIATPNLDRLAADGTRMTQFYNTARCSPSRASLLTGLHPHQTGIGILTGDDSPVGYPGTLNRAGATIAEILKGAGYHTGLVGKWHLASSIWERDDAWPTRRGFDYFYGTLTGCGSFFEPGTLVRGETPIPEEAKRDDFYYTDAISDEAVGFIERTTPDSEPFFLYVAYTAPHWPLHAPEAAIDAYEGRFDDGWDVLREQRIERQRSLGLVADDTVLSPRDPDEPAWSDVPDKEWQARRMEVYAAQVTIMDTGIGRILDAIEASGTLDDTIVVFLSDNGASPEELPHIRDFESHTEFYSPVNKRGESVHLGNRPEIIPGSDRTYASYGRPWANLSNTPFRLYKKWVHEGGIAAPFIFHWPAGQIGSGAILKRPHQLTHVLPTILEAAGVAYPDEVGDRRILPAEGSSFLTELIMNNAVDTPIAPDQTLYWEHCGNAAVRRGDWKLVRRYPRRWELYDLSTDPTELRDVLAGHRELAEELFTAWSIWASRVGVVPFERIVELYELRGESEVEAAR